MISVEEKLRVFTQYLLNKERKWGKDIINEAKEKQEELVENSNAKIMKEKRSIEERSYHMIFRDKNKIIAEGKNKAKVVELEEKNKILMNFNTLIKDKALDYIDKDVYNKYLSDCVNKIPEIFKEKKELILYTKEEDSLIVKGFIETKLPEYSVDYRIEQKDFIGGMTVEDINNRIYFDFTIDNLIKTNYKLVGMTLNGFMEKQVN
jgi:vacuolar-type H+-ATPase subunit E/Vma4